MQWLEDRPIPETSEKPGQPLLVDDVSWLQQIGMTADDVLTCYQCGSCSSICPWSVVDDHFSLPRRLLRLAQLGLADSPDMLWMCTDCKQCVSICPREVKIPEIIETIRNAAWKKRKVPAGLPGILWSIYWNNNPWSQPPSTRAAWADTLELPHFDPELHEYLLFIGCTSSFDRRLIRVAQALVKLLKRASVPFGILGEDEPCCGDAALSVGNRPFFEDLILGADRTFSDQGVKKLVILSPHCFEALSKHYSEKSDGCPEVIHYTQFLLELISDGKLVLDSPVGMKITYHDPCLLARANTMCDVPRQLMADMPDLELMEMPRTRESTFCCGGGGGRMWQETDAGLRFSDIRAVEAAETGAETLVTSCPFCISLLEDSVNSNPDINLKVMDIAELCLMGSVEHE